MYNYYYDYDFEKKNIIKTIEIIQIKEIKPKMKE